LRLGLTTDARKRIDGDQGGHFVHGLMGRK
jgi:hypothetical protein